MQLCSAHFSDSLFISLVVHYPRQVLPRQCLCPRMGCGVPTAGAEQSRFLVRTRVQCWSTGVQGEPTAKPWEAPSQRGALWTLGLLPGEELQTCVHRGFSRLISPLVISLHSLLPLKSYFTEWVCPSEQEGVVITWDKSHCSLIQLDSFDEKLRIVSCHQEVISTLGKPPFC